MKTKTRVIVIRSKGEDVVRQYPIYQYETLDEAVREHGESFVLATFQWASEQRARAQERATLEYEIRSKDR